MLRAAPTARPYATTGLYAAHRWEITEALVLSNGLRYSRVRVNAAFDPRFFPAELTRVTQQSGSLDGNLGLVALLPTGLRLNGLVATGFRAPNIDDLNKTFEQTHGTLINPNPNLAPERVLNYEAEVSETVADRLLLPLTGFYTNLHNTLFMRHFSANDGRLTTACNDQTYITVGSHST